MRRVGSVVPMGHNSQMCTVWDDSFERQAVKESLIPGGWVCWSTGRIDIYKISLPKIQEYEALYAGSEDATIEVLKRIFNDHLARLKVRDIYFYYPQIEEKQQIALSFKEFGNNNIAPEKAMAIKTLERVSRRIIDPVCTIEINVPFYLLISGTSDSLKLHRIPSILADCKEGKNREKEIKKGEAIAILYEGEALNSVLNLTVIPAKVKKIAEFILEHHKDVQDIAFLPPESLGIDIFFKERNLGGVVFIKANNAFKIQIKFNTAQGVPSKIADLP